MKDLWKVQLEEHFIKVESGHFCNCKYMELDGIGFMLEYNENNPEHLDPDFIRRHLHGVRHTFAWIEAESKEEAIKTFHKEWDGAKVGTRQKALIIEHPEKIKMIERCKIRHRNKQGGFVCGLPMHDLPDEWFYEDDKENMNGEFGMCWIEGYDCPDVCPVPFDEEDKLDG